MTQRAVGIVGAGIATDGYADIHALGRALEIVGQVAMSLGRVKCVDAGVLPPLDPLTQWALSALHQAMTMAGGFNNEEMALLVVTAWGMVDATVAFLDSMLDADGRYASPRHFTRSVYSAPASAIAIHFGIHGPCQTLAFDHAENPIDGALAQAWRLIAAGRAERVAIVWAEQGGTIAADLAERAARDLHRREFARYASGNVGQGAVAVIVVAPRNAAALGDVHILPQAPVMVDGLAGKPFPMDAAVGFLAGVLAQKHSGV